MSPNESFVVDDDRRVEKNGKPSDEELMARVQKGIPDAYNELLHRFSGELIRYLERYLKQIHLPPHFAEDVAQETWHKVFMKSHLFESGRKFRPWLYKIATNKAIDKQRGDRRHRAVSLTTKSNASGGDTVELMDLLVADEIGPDEAASRREQVEWIRQEMDVLSEELRAVVGLVIYQGLKYREAADILSIPLGTVKSQMHRAIQTITEDWDKTHSAVA